MSNSNLLAHNTFFAVLQHRGLGNGFFDDACKKFYLRRLLHCQNVFQVELHAYLLLENRILLLFTPRTPKSFGSFIDFLNESYNSYYQVRFDRNVQVWEDRTPACVLASDRLVIDCQKFIERSVLALDGYNHPGEYRYSSYCANAFTRNSGLLNRHRAVFRNFPNAACALQDYRDFIATPFREEYERYLRSRLLSGRPLLTRREPFRLEKNRALTDIDKSATIAVN